MNKVTNKTKRTRSPRKRASTPQVAPVMSQRELACLGGGEIAYIKVLTSEEAQRLYPMIEGLPGGMNLYALHAADGTPIALTDSRQAAIGHARGDKLEIASVH